MSVHSRHIIKIIYSTKCIYWNSKKNKSEKTETFKKWERHTTTAMYWFFSVTDITDNRIH